MLLSLYGAFSSYAYSVASKSDAEYYMQNAQEFVSNYVPMGVDQATKSNAIRSKLLKSTSPILRTSLPTVTNTVDRTDINVLIVYPDQTSKRLRGIGSDGHFKYTDPDGKKISRVHFEFPRNAFPTSGIFDMSMSIRAVATANVLSGTFGYNKNVNSMVANSYQELITNNSFQKQLGDVYLPPTSINVQNFTTPYFAIAYEAVSSTVDLYFSLRFTMSSTPAAQSLSVGTEYSSSENAYNTAQNTAQLVYSQNETNGLLHDIIQHISDQLAAMWDQIYNLMAVPWIQNDNQRTNNTISAIEENSQDTQTTIEEQTQWHGNFIIEGLKGLFIPSDDYFSSVTTDLFDWFEDKFGFLGYTLTYFIRLLNGIMSASQNTVIHFPGIKVPNRATSEVYNILPEQDVDLGAQIGMISEGTFSLLEFMRTAGDIVIVLGFVVMLQNKLHEVETQ